MCYVLCVRYVRCVCFGHRFWRLVLVFFLSILILISMNIFSGSYPLPILFGSDLGTFGDFCYQYK